jgi:hypothetical protein
MKSYVGPEVEQEVGPELVMGLLMGLEVARNMNLDVITYLYQATPTGPEVAQEMGTEVSPGVTSQVAVVPTNSLMLFDVLIVYLVDLM